MEDVQLLLQFAGHICSIFPLLILLPALSSSIYKSSIIPKAICVVQILMIWTHFHDKEISILFLDVSLDQKWSFSTPLWNLRPAMGSFAQVWSLHTSIPARGSFKSFSYINEIVASHTHPENTKGGGVQVEYPTHPISKFRRMARRVPEVPGSWGRPHWLVDHMVCRPHVVRPGPRSSRGSQ